MQSHLHNHLQHKLYREELTKRKIQNDSLMNALTTYISKYDVAMAEELKNLVSIYKPPILGSGG